MGNDAQHGITLHVIGGKTWWVPRRCPSLFAVRMTHPDEYQRAVRNKLAVLIEEAGKEGLELIRAVTSAGGERLHEPEDPESLAAEVLANSSVGFMAHDLGPGVGEPATHATAVAAVADQDALTLFDFLRRTSSTHVSTMPSRTA